jgi:REP element-mobilizing transposase RayT
MELTPRTRGGKRRGAGRRPTMGRRVPHLPRGAIRRRSVVHVTCKFVPGVGRLRRYGIAGVLRAAFVRTAARQGFLICQFSIQGNHIHLVVEASSTVALARGVQGWATSVARRLNAALGRRGDVFADRYHSVLLRTPRQVRNAICYVLQNARRHGERLDRRLAIDPFSSAWWFDGWAHEDWRIWRRPPPDRPPVAPAESWLLTTGWRRWGLIDPAEVPAARRR